MSTQFPRTKFLQQWLEETAFLVIVVVLSVLLMALLSGCANTVTPRIVKESVASWDGTNQNSGFIGFTPDGSGIITSHARDRYNGLVAIYSSHFLPPLKADEGLRATATNTFLIDPQHLQYFGTMNRWRKQGL